MTEKSRIIQWKHGTAEETASYTGEAGEFTIVDENHGVRVHDGATPGGTELLFAKDVPKALSSLADDIGVWKKSELTKVSQLTNDGFTERAKLTKLSQLTNDSQFKTAHCTYCNHCTYCSQCSNCYDCTTVDCTTIQCNASNCRYCCDDCGDDGG